MLSRVSVSISLNGLYTLPVLSPMALRIVFFCERVYDLCKGDCMYKCRRLSSAPGLGRFTKRGLFVNLCLTKGKTYDLTTPRITTIRGYETTRPTNFLTSAPDLFLSDSISYTTAVFFLPLFYSAAPFKRRLLAHGSSLLQHTFPMSFSYIWRPLLCKCAPLYLCM